MTTRRIVVGIDGSAASHAALRWAADEAHRRCVGLDVVHACPVSVTAGLSAATTAALTADCTAHAAGLLDAARDELAAGGVTVPVRTRALARPIADQLIQLGDEAELLVLGRGPHDSAEAQLGSVSHRVAAYARCPTVVVPEDARPHPVGVSPVVAVGVSRSGAVPLALDAAFGHAQRAGGSVLAVRAWGSLDWASRVSLYTPEAAERWRLASEHLLEDAVGRLARNYPTVPVQTRLVDGSVLSTLLAAAADADLLMLNGRLRPDAGSSQLGWTATVLIAEAPCPVQLVGQPLPAPAQSARPPVTQAVPRRELALASAS